MFTSMIKTELYGDDDRDSNSQKVLSLLWCSRLGAIKSVNVRLIR